MQRRKPLIAGNWKMNGLAASLAEVAALRAGLTELGALDGLDVLICPPATLIASMVNAAAGSAIMVGGQDCHAKTSGAFTGDISAAMLTDSGAGAVILGHSERRSLHGERDCDVKAKAIAALNAKLQPIICVGETAGERLMGLTIDVVGRQLSGSLPAPDQAAPLIIAYEPVWAIGTGLTPRNADIVEVHAAIRDKIATIFGKDAAQAARILYGGSVKPENALEILALDGVDGALVGGASLFAKDFLAIIAAQLKNLA